MKTKKAQPKKQTTAVLNAASPRAAYFLALHKLQKYRIHPDSFDCVALDDVIEAAKCIRHSWPAYPQNDKLTDGGDKRL